jgi:protoporphyrinogen oxidase
MSDQEVIDHVIRSLTGMGLISPGSVILTGLYRHRFAYVVYDLHYLDNIAIIREYFDKAGISLVGRFSRFEYLNMDGCIRNAIDFVRGS